MLNSPIHSSMIVTIHGPAQQTINPHEKDPFMNNVNNILQLDVRVDFEYTVYSRDIYSIMGFLSDIGGV
jgi:hypothetical protein